MAIALKHLSEPPAPISHLRPDVHPALEAVVMAALAKDPAQRWQTAADFAEGLEAARAQIEAGANGGQDTAAFAAIPMPGPATVTDETVPAATVLEPVGAVAAERRRRWPWFTIGLLALVLLGFLIWLVASGELTTEKNEVPRVTAKQLVEARAILERAGFEVETERVRSSQPFDQVVDQDPNPGVEAEAGSTVTLEVSDGPGTVRVPGVEGLPLAQAIDDLEDADLRVNVDREFSDKVRERLAIGTVPREGDEVTKGTRVRLLVSRGPEQATVPDVTGLSRDSAEARLRDEGLGVAVQEQESDEPEGEVIAQDPAGGTRVDRGETVTITVSTGREQVDVPNVIGLEARDAVSQIGAAGLTAVERERDVTDPAQDGVVIDQRPGAGVELDEGGQVVIIVGALVEEDVLEPPVEPETP